MMNIQCLIINADIILNNYTANFVLGIVACVKVGESH